jgi:hypothetical protein
MAMKLIFLKIKSGKGQKGQGPQNSKRPDLGVYKALE